MRKRLDEHALPNIIKQSIIDEILQGEIKVGDKLIEAKYSELFGTSRAPIREAFYLLNLEGFVEKIPRKGTIVKEFTLEEMHDILHIRNFLEQLSLDRMDVADRIPCAEEMQKLIAKMEEAKVSRKEYTKLNYEYHLQLILATHSDVIKNTYSRLASPLISLQTLSFLKEEAIAKSIVEHKEITAHIAQGNIEKAKQLLDKHNRDVFPRIKDMK